ncbi:FAD-linked oxidase [Glaciecola punicea]|jgi:FAD/FMN-containing dehydrogenase|uniref:FAD-binding oxidoreductase n=1 Tax=Glaciecola punicea TaxID=56804 RepID=UPI00087263FF|nr:FAD-binding oxidoreductase [Glaciecola punicea]OFA29843.1 FAD-linked oxidase [Glaciecola punicea]
MNIDKQSKSDDLEKLKQNLHQGSLLTDEVSRELYSSDLFVKGELCVAVAVPASESEVSKVVSTATALGLHVIPRGAGLTYVEGYTPKSEKSLVIDLSKMNNILEINKEDMYIRVEAGVTWKQIYEALHPHGLRLPFLGTFSGARATVGGGLSNGALFFGSARYGTSAEIVLNIDAVLANGDILRTGQRSVLNSRSPAYRTFGPDLTGLFVHDSGSLGIKTSATLKIIKVPQYFGYASFGFKSVENAIAAISEIGRSDLVEEAYVMDPNKTKESLSASDFKSDLSTFSKVIKQERNPLKGMKAGFNLAINGKRFVDEGIHSLHMVCSARSEAALEHDLQGCRDIAHSFDGIALPDSIPRAARASLFPPLDAIVGPKGERWVALNAKVAHSQALNLYNRAEAILANYSKDFECNHVEVTRLLMILSNFSFSYEPVFNWKDTWLPMHHTSPAIKRNKIPEPEPNEEARQLVEKVRQELINLFHEIGAASNQIGKTYPYITALHSEPASLIKAIKKSLDPDNLMNPGVLGL